VNFKAHYFLYWMIFMNDRYYLFIGSVGLFLYFGVELCLLGELFIGFAVRP